MWDKDGGVEKASNIVRVIKSRRLRWAGYVARMEEVGVSSKLYQANLQETDH